MDVPSHEAGEKQTFTVLVTGANSGLGFAICCRLIDEFLLTRPQSQDLHLLFSTRDTKKGEDALERLNAHLQKTLKEADQGATGISLLLEPRIKLEGVLVDLTKLPTVKALAKQLLTRKQHLDAVVWNAGIAGWSGMNWPRAMWSVSTGLVQGTTYPDYMICNVGLLTKPQLAGYGTVHTFPEPRLGQVFTANVFGHYLLTHWLAPLMDGESRIVWISSIAALPETFSLQDMQGLRATMSYESSKRLTDLLVLTSDLPSIRPYTKAFLPTTDEKESRPRMYVTQPGVISTSISGMNWFISLFMVATMYIARWIGSPWHPVTAYKGAVSAVFAILAPPSQLSDREAREGKAKWGSATDVFGDERVVRTEIEGWGYGGELGSMPSGSIGINRKGHKAATKESREDFEDAGIKVWREMEELRMEWEGRLGKVEIDAASTLDT